MENQFLEKWEEVEAKVERPRSFRKMEIVNFEDFKKAVFKQDDGFIDSVVKSLYAGDAYILKGAFSNDYLQELIQRTHKYGVNSKSEYHPMLEGCPDFNRIVDEEVTKKYSIETVRFSHYFFPWNSDPLNLFEVINERWRVFKQLGGFSFDAYESNTPKDGVVDRIQICKYPVGGGKLNPHYDPVTNQRVIIGAMMSKRGEDYETGGFYCINSKLEKVDFEPFLDIGDMVCCYATVVHGVDPVDLHLTRDWTKVNGRWFLGLYSNDTDYKKDRNTAVPLTRIEDYILSK